MGAIFPFPTRGLHLQRRRGQRPVDAAQLDAGPIPSERYSSHHRRLTTLFSLFLSFREPQDLAASGPEADLYPEGRRHCEPTNPVPGDHASPMLGP